MGSIQEKFGMAQEDQKTKSVDRLVIPICLVLPDSIVEQVALNEDQMFDCVANIFLIIPNCFDNEFRNQISYDSVFKSGCVSVDEVLK